MSANITVFVFVPSNHVLCLSITHGSVTGPRTGSTEVHYSGFCYTGDVLEEANPMKANFQELNVGARRYVASAI